MCNSYNFLDRYKCCSIIDPYEIPAIAGYSKHTVFQSVSRWLRQLYKSEMLMLLPAAWLLPMDNCLEMDLFVTYLDFFLLRVLQLHVCLTNVFADCHKQSRIKSHHLRLTSSPRRNASCSTAQATLPSCYCLVQLLLLGILISSRHI
jgi:hypothetical protein